MDPGKGNAIAGAVCGVAGILFLPFEGTLFVSLFLGIEGLMQTAKAGKAGFCGGIRTAGFALSLLDTLLSSVVLAARVILAGILGLLFTSGGLGG